MKESKLLTLYKSKKANGYDENNHHNKIETKTT